MLKAAVLRNLNPEINPINQIRSQAFKIPNTISPTEYYSRTKTRKPHNQISLIRLGCQNGPEFKKISQALRL